MLSFRGHIWQTYCYRIIFADAEVLMVHIRNLTLDLHVAVDACTVVRGLLHDLRCSGYSPINMLYMRFETNGIISQLRKPIYLFLLYNPNPSPASSKKNLYFLSISRKKKRKAEDTESGRDSDMRHKT